MCPLPILVGVVLLLCPAVSQLTWHRVSSGGNLPSPSPRKDAVLAYDPWGQRLILFGGRTRQRETEVVLGDTWVYNIKSDSWEELVGRAPRPPARYSSVSGRSGQHLYVSTGRGANRLNHGDIWRLYLPTLTWEEMPTPVAPRPDSVPPMVAMETVTPTPRYGAAGGIYHNGTRFYVTMGCSDRRHDDALSYSISETSWFVDAWGAGTYTPTGPHARCQHAATMLGPDLLLTAGGCLSGEGAAGPCPSADTWLFNGRTKSWGPLTSCSAPSMNAGLALLPLASGAGSGGRRAVMFGGKETGRQVLLTVESPSNQVGVFNADTMEWSLRQTEGDTPSKRQAVAMATGGEGIFMFGGEDISDGKLRNDVYILLGDGATADLAPQIDACKPTFISLIILHGIFMALAFGFFLPWGAFVARYYQHTDSVWFHLHRLFQVFGLLMGVAGLVCAVVSVNQSNHFRFTHGIVGLVTMVIVVIQPFLAMCRPPVPIDGGAKSVRRVIWEFAHVFLGRGAICLGLANASLGVFLSLSSLILWALWYSYLGLLCLIFAVTETVHYYKLKIRAQDADIYDNISQKYLVDEAEVEAEPDYASPRDMEQDIHPLSNGDFMKPLETLGVEQLENSEPL